MQAILVLFAAFIVIGLLSRGGFTSRTRLLVFLTALTMVVYVTISAMR